ncbi:MAG: monomethylamine:corrinoid methyltransferase [Candidatus Bathyarchaeia archaeon]
MLDVCDRAEIGSICKEKDFDLKIITKKANSLVKDYKIHYDPLSIVPSDNSMADSVFDAGFQLALETGLFCKDTQRIIKFSEEELKEAIKSAPDMLDLGEGKDKVTMKFRGIESDIKPIIAGGGAGMLVSEDVYVKLLATFIKDPIIDTFGGSHALRKVYGRLLTPKSPLEVLLVKREAQLVKEALTMVGRPGMHVIMGGGGSTALGAIAGYSTEGGLRRTDGLLIAILPELKTDYIRLSMAIHQSSYGGIAISLIEPIIGYAGGPEVSAIIGVAAILLSTLAYGVKYHLFGPVNLKYPASTTNRECLWVENIVGQAISRKTRMLITNNIIACSGPCTEQVLYETAAACIGNVPSGWHMGPGVGASSTKIENGGTGLETKFMAECSLASIGLSRDEANKLVDKFLAKVEPYFKNPLVGKTFLDCYDIEKLEPTYEWLEIYKKVKKEVEDFGLKF